MVWVHGNKGDFDGWAANGCPGWTYDECLPWFQKQEDQEDDTNPTAGKGGPLPLTNAGLHEPNPASAAFIEACAALGYDRDRGRFQLFAAKAIVLNLLSLTATFGAMVWVFQEGHLGGLVGTGGELAAALRDKPGRMAQKLSGFGAAPLHVAGREVIADVARAYRAEHGIGEHLDQVRPAHDPADRSATAGLAEQLGGEHRRLRHGPGCGE